MPERTAAGVLRAGVLRDAARGVDVRNPAPPPPAPELLDRIPAVLARRARALPATFEDGVLRVRSVTGLDDDPDLDVLRLHVGAYDVIADQDADTVRHLLRVYAHHTLPQVRTDPVALLDTVLDLAVGSEASDVHLEPTADGMRIRQRVDGDLHDVVHVPETAVRALVARTKVQAGLDASQRRLPQDGHLRHAFPDGSMDVRVATMPTHSGERVTLRLLPDGPNGVALSTLGLPDDTVHALRRASHATDGLIIVCGPTGSGKTTTLHALLTLVTARARNVMTLEDPVERVVRGASQTQVDPEHGLTFATGLRHLLRHDPDVMMVGEIRDRDTARLAVDAAHTGHLVLTSLHAVDAPAALTRLVELGVTASLLADTVRLIVAQRLLALPCPDCATAARSHDCRHCSGTGTRGRRAIGELLELDESLRALLRSGQNPAVHHAALAAAVSPRLRDIALDRARRGLARGFDAAHATPAATSVPSDVHPRDVPDTVLSGAPTGPTIPTR